MNAAKRADSEGEDGAPMHAPPETDPEMLTSSRRTFTGFVRASTFTAIAIALLLIGMALFLL